MAKKKSNDKIPADEMLLAEALAAAGAHNLKGETGLCFHTDSHGKLNAVCAVGAIALAANPRIKAKIDRGSLVDGYDAARPLLKKRVRTEDTDAVFSGNDWCDRWNPPCDTAAADNGESLGWAFRQAMED